MTENNNQQGEEPDEKEHFWGKYFEDATPRRIIDPDEYSRKTMY